MKILRFSDRGRTFWQTIRRSVYLSVYLSIGLSIYLSIYLPIYLCVCGSKIVCEYIYIHINQVSWAISWLNWFYLHRIIISVTSSRNCAMLGHTSNSNQQIYKYKQPVLLLDMGCSLPSLSDLISKFGHGRVDHFSGGIRTCTNYWLRKCTQASWHGT